MVSLLEGDTSKVLTPVLSLSSRARPESDITRRISDLSDSSMSVDGLAARFAWYFLVMRSTNTVPRPTSNA